MSNPYGDMYKRRKYCVSLFIFSSVIFAILLNLVFFKYRFMLDIPVYIISFLISGFYYHYRSEMLYASYFMTKYKTEEEEWKSFTIKVLLCLFSLLVVFLNLYFFKYRFNYDYKLYIVLFLIEFFYLIDNLIILNGDSRGIFGLYSITFGLLILLPIQLILSSYQLIFHFKGLHDTRYKIHLLLSLIFYVLHLKTATILLMNLSGGNYNFKVYIISCLVFFVLSCINAYDL